MSDNPLQAFLTPRKIDETRKIIVSDAFPDADGNPIPFEIKAISDEENNAIKKATRKLKDGRGGGEVMDFDEYAGRLMVACTLFPPFANAELCAAYGTTIPYQVPSKMLKTGEAQYLLQQINDLCGFDNAAQRVLDDAKN